MTTTTRTPLRRAAAAALLAGSIVTGLGVATAAPATAAVTPIGTVDGHRAFGIGPHSSAAACAATADRLSSFGAKRFGPRFGTCYRTGNGQWWAISPWSA
ncbi:hypothetical protein O4158_21040 [Gordonia amicalis]|uniref:hypothetical protein n=1 Tax=Gordonia amicalis TaxID=89053 RepID=UPI0022B41653|nr:hypothetical protein [Gordonia amicalis]MCZ4581526.1 hypothetical protein [Gordonia amicalis]